MDQQEAFLQGDFFGDDSLGDLFEEVNQVLANARDEKDLIDLAAQWFKELPNLKRVSERSFTDEVKKRVSKINNLEERKLQRKINREP